MADFREREYQEEQRARRARRDREEHGRRDRGETDGYQHDDEASATDRDEPLRIEAPSQLPPVDLRDLGTPQHQQNLAANISGGLVGDLAPETVYPSGQPILVGARGTGEAAGHVSGHTQQALDIPEYGAERREREQQERIDRGGGQDMAGGFDASRYSQEV